MHKQYCLMFFSDYSEFLETEPQQSMFRPVGRDFHLAEAQYLAEMSAQHDLAYSEFTSVISKRLVAQTYPSSFQNCNPFCPLCLRFVQQEASFTTCFINNDRNYLIHQQCLKREKGYELRNVGEIVQSEIYVQEGKLDGKGKSEVKGDMRQFYVQITVTHPINDKHFMKVSKKVNLTKKHFWIEFNQQQQNSYFPNIVLIPMTDYHVTVSCSEVGNRENSIKMTKYLTFKQIRDKRAVINCEDIAMEVQPILQGEERKRLIDDMNYKYRFNSQHLPMIRIHALKIALPQQLEESDEDFMIGSGSTIVEELLNQKQYSISTIRTSEPSPVKLNRLLTDSNSSNQAQWQKINLQKLINTNTLIDFVKSSSHSRQFQHFLTQCSEHQLVKIIINLKQKMVELITHEYGNYMMQKLFAVCRPVQRLELLQFILPHLCELAKNKQGTHTTQAFLQCFSLNEEYSLVSLQIMQEFYALSCHSNATYFIQKIVKTFPLQYMIGYFQFIAQNLMAFALNKNGMCVVKHMMRRLREFQGKEVTYDQAIDIVRRQLIFNVTFNVDNLIVDSYGNYVIQFCYELFDEQKCSGITERILLQFLHYATGKYSTSVLLKCISTYWTDRRVYQSLRGLSNCQILQLFRNKDGNKILLCLMEKQEGSEIWQRIYSVLMQAEPTKFYHDRWGVCLGCRSGQVGTRFTAFPQARKRNYNRRY